MTPDLPTKLERALAFDSKRANRMAHEGRERTMLAREHDDGKSLGDRIKTACFYAAKDEHARLAPLHAKLIAAVRALEYYGKGFTSYEHHVDDTKPPGEHARLALASLNSALDGVERGGG